MLEYPEVRIIANQLKNEIVGCNVEKVLPPTKLHKFCWFSYDVNTYNDRLLNSKIVDVKGFGLFVEIIFSNNYHLCINDGVNARLINKSDVVNNYQLVIYLNDDKAIVFTVAMYGGIVLHQNDFDNDYYNKSKKCVDLLDKDFKSYFYNIYNNSLKKLSIKAFLATDQKFVGLGNGVLQDILWESRLNPHRKIGTLTDNEKEELVLKINQVLTEMINYGGRDTEKDIFGNSGKYITKMSKNTYKNPCPVCKGEIIKEAYLGGSVYYCPNCQR